MASAPVVSSRGMPVVCAKRASSLSAPDHSAPLPAMVEIAAMLVDAGMLNRQDEDSVEDFRSGFDFDEAFVESYEPRLRDADFDPGNKSYRL